MFCTKCGKKNLKGSNFCISCGTSFDNSVALDEVIRKKQQNDKASSFKIQEDIRKSLKAFDEHENVTCLECGYNGLMGIKANVIPWYVSWWAIAFIVFAFAIFGGVGFVLGLCLGFLRFTLKSHVVVCPNCCAEGKPK